MSIHSKITNNHKIATDGFANIAKGIGGEKDVLQNSTYVRNALNLNMNPELAEELYQENWLVGNIADIPANEATRSFCDITSNKDEELKKVKKLFKKLKLKQKIKTGLAFADLFGGSTLYMVVNDFQTQDKPLNLKNIRPNSFKELRVLEPSHLVPVATYLKEPEQYLFQGIHGENFIIHKSRLLIFKGLELTQNKTVEMNYWGGSKVQRSMAPILASDTTINAIVNMLTETNVNVYQMEGLTQMAIDGEDEDAIKRIKLIDVMKSYLNAIVLDKNDDFVKRTNDFKDLHQIDNATLIRVSGSAEIPATLLFGKSPDGQNATGASDLQNFHNRIHRLQTDKIEPFLEILISVASYSENGCDIEDYEIFWNSLVQETKKEKADREKVESDTDSTLLETKVVTIEDVRKATRASNSRYSFLEDRKEVVNA